ncbi:MAG: thiamine pyrophosphate-binding protein [Dehalococcoidia bacterium]|nr:thiamine pyrophosphate-binding protein [Dehalococcoidia bacterium]
MYPWEAVAHMVQAQGVDMTFGIGDSHLQLYAEKTDGLRAVNVRYEGSAPFMAMAYARLSGKPGVCSASTGPGIANMVPGALEALSGCSPLVMLCHSINQKTEGMGEFQECDQLGMMRPVTKWAVRVNDINRLSWYVNRAFSLAMNDQPGPVFVEIPYDVGGDITHGISADIVEPHFRAATRLRTAGDPDTVSRAADLLLQAKRPVMLAGTGAMLSGAGGAFMRLAEKLGMPFATSPGGRGIGSENHPLALGLVGMYRNTLAKEYLMSADLVLTVGSRNEAFQTHRWEDMPAGARFIQIDAVASEIGRNWVPDVGIAGDASLVLQQLLQTIEEHNQVPAGTGSARTTEIATAKRELLAAVDSECATTEYPFAAKRIVHELSNVFGNNTVLVNENGSQDSWSFVYPYYTVGDQSICVPVAEQTCMGMGVVGAIAAKLTMPDKNVVCVTGDGAFQMYMKELPTAAQYGAGCTWVVLNNSSFGWPGYYQMQTVGWNTTTFTVQPDLAAVARACGCHGRRVETLEGIRPALEEALQLNNKGIPVVLDFPVGQDMTHFDRAR